MPDKVENLKIRVELFEKIDKCLLKDERPSIRIRELSKERSFMLFPFSMLLKLEKTQQSPKHHPEGNVWNHTMMVVDKASEMKSRSSSPRVLLWAAFLHDLGKPETTKIRNGRITAYDHDKVGSELAEIFLKELTDDEDFIERVKWLVRYHMQILYVVKGLPYQDVAGIKAHTDVEEAALLGYCNRLGRAGSNQEAEEQNTQIFLQKLRSPQ